MSSSAVVTGSDKGIGFAIVKVLPVCQRFNGIGYLTSRDNKRGREALEELKKIGLKPQYHQLDVADRSSVETFKNYIKEKYGGIDPYKQRSSLRYRFQSLQL